MRVISGLALSGVMIACALSSQQELAFGKILERFSGGLYETNHRLHNVHLHLHTKLVVHTMRELVPINRT